MSSQKRMRENPVEYLPDLKFEESRLLSHLETSSSSSVQGPFTSLQDPRLSRLSISYSLPSTKTEQHTTQGHRVLPDGLCYTKCNLHSAEQSLVNNYFNAIENVKQQLVNLQRQSPGVIKYLTTLEHYRRFESILSEKHDLNTRYDTRLLQENMGFIKRVWSLLKEYSLSQPSKKIKLESSTFSETSWENEFMSALKTISKMTQDQKQHFKLQLARVRSLPRSSMLARRCDLSKYS